MTQEEKFAISISLISNANKLTLSQLEFNAGVNFKIVIDNLTNRFAFTLKNIKKYGVKIGLSFNQKIDIELSNNYSIIKLSELRGGELVVLNIPNPRDEKSVFEMKLEKLKKTLSLVFKSLIETLNSPFIDYQFPKEGFEVMLLKDEYKTLLSDYEIYLLLRGLKEPQAREIASNFENNGFLFSENTKHRSEKYILNLEEKYGIDFLKNLLEIPEKPFGLNTVSRLKEKMRNSKGEVISLSFDGVNNYEFEIRTDLINIKKNNEYLGKCNLDGILNYSNSKSNSDKYMTATLMLYYANDPNGEILYFGQKTGCCSFCKKPLVDPISIYWGYGKTCAEINGLSWG